MIRQEYNNLFIPTAQVEKFLNFYIKRFEIALCRFKRLRVLNVQSLVDPLVAWIHRHQSATQHFQQFLAYDWRKIKSETDASCGFQIRRCFAFDRSAYGFWISTDNCSEIGIIHSTPVEQEFNTLFRVIRHLSSDAEPLLLLLFPHSNLTLWGSVLKTVVERDVEGDVTWLPI